MSKSRSIRAGSLPFLHPAGWHRQRKNKVDLDRLYLYLWKHTDKWGILKPNFETLAARLNLTKPRVKKYFVILQEQKRVKAFGNQILVADPKLWAFNRNVLDAVEKMPGKRSK